jgi:hypothetical protein
VGAAFEEFRQLSQEPTNTAKKEGAP